MWCKYIDVILTTPHVITFSSIMLLCERQDLPEIITSMSFPELLEIYHTLVHIHLFQRCLKYTIGYYVFVSSSA